MEKSFSDIEIDRIIEMAWEDRTSFEAIELQFGINQDAVIILMRKFTSPKGFRRWRKRTKGRETKHESLRTQDVRRFKCSRQRTISKNGISKR